MIIVKKPYNQLDLVVKGQIKLLESEFFNNEFSSIYNSDTQVYVAYIIDIGYITYKDLGESIDIYNTAISRIYQNQGYGKLLFESLFELKKDLILEVRVSNLRAISFYKGLGFKEIRVIKNYYQTEDAVVMIKKEAL